MSVCSLVLFYEIWQYDLSFPELRHPSTNLSSFTRSSEGREHEKHSQHGTFFLFATRTLSQYLLFSSSHGWQMQEKDPEKVEYRRMAWKRFTVTSKTLQYHIKHQIKEHILPSALQTVFYSSAVLLERSWSGAVCTIVLSIKIASCYCESPPHAAFQTPLEWPNNPQRPHQNMNTTEPQIPHEKTIQTHQYTTNTLISLCIAALKTELCCICYL